MKREQKEAEEKFDNIIKNMTMGQKKEINDLPYKIKEGIEKLDESEREEIGKRIAELCNLGDATNFEKFPKTVREWLEKDIESILGITYEELISTISGERFLLNTLRFFIFKLNTILKP